MGRKRYTPEQIISMLRELDKNLNCMKVVKTRARYYNHPPDDSVQPVDLDNS